QRMDDGFEPLEARRIREQHLAQLAAIDLAARSRAGKSGLDRRDRGPLVELVHLGIRIADGYAEVAQARSDRRLAHADGAGEGDDKHQRPSMSATTSARSSSVTAGRTPNHFSKPGTAW